MPSPADPGRGFALEGLEFAAVQELLLQRVRTPMGYAGVEGLTPSSDAGVVAERRALLSEALALARAGELPGLPALGDPLPALSRLDIAGACLDAEGLRTLTRLAAAGRSAAVDIRALRQTVPGLAAIADLLPDLRRFLDATRHTFTPDGGIDDAASPELRALRRRGRNLAERLRKTLAAYLEGPEAERYLQDDFVTSRNSRFVIPVRVEKRESVKGIVHGSSTSGATLFIEPLATVEMNNDLVRVRDAEQAEIRRILELLTGEARDLRGPLADTARLLGRFDGIWAAARLGVDYSLQPASPSVGGELRLRGARHLLLHERLREEGGVPVPIDIEMSGEDRVLVISGPNTGGKTVALKTVGLAALMNQSGLPVPADEAILPVFRQVLADIGDHQSIAENLSTFSSHIAALRRMTEQVSAEALVLLDELGTGTDPEEGAALGVALVEHLLERRAMVLLNTHHNGLKTYAEITPGVVNASMEFDEQKLQPTYRLRMGVPGRSGGLDIAERLGLPCSIIAAARSRVSRAGRRADEDLARLSELIAAAEQERAAAESERGQAERDRHLLQREIEDRRLQHGKQLADELARAEETFRKALITALEGVEEDVADQRKLRRIRDKAQREFARGTRGFAPPGDGEDEPGRPLPLAVGSAVRVRNLGLSGRVERIDGERVVVSVGEKRIELMRGDLVAGAPATPAPTGAVSRPETETETELKLLGQRVEEALEQLDRFLDRAVLAGAARLRVVHGHGTGRLKRAVRQHLQRHPGVESHEPASPAEGGDGATVVQVRV